LKTADRRQQAAVRKEIRPTVCCLLSAACCLRAQTRTPHNRRQWQRAAPLDVSRTHRASRTTQRLHIGNQLFHLVASALARIDPALLATNGPLDVDRAMCSMGAWAGNDRAVSVAAGSSPTPTSGLVSGPARRQRARWPGGRRPKRRGADAILITSLPTAFSVVASATTAGVP
jgi:hypothetical protein